MVAMRPGPSPRRPSLAMHGRSVARAQRTTRLQLLASLALVALCQFVSGPAHEFLHAGPAHVEHDPTSNDGCVHLRGDDGHDTGLHEQHPCLTCHVGRAHLALAATPAPAGLDLTLRDRLPPARPDRDHSVVPEGILGARGPPALSA